jgi:hypothetical protein
MAQQKAGERTTPRQRSAASDETFKRSGPEPPENDSGPSPSIEESLRSSERHKTARIPEPTLGERRHS